MTLSSSGQPARGVSSELADFSQKGPDSKYSRFCGPYGSSFQLGVILHSRRLETCVVATLGRGCHGHRVGRDQGCCSVPCDARAGPPRTDASGPKCQGRARGEALPCGPCHHHSGLSLEYGSRHRPCGSGGGDCLPATLDLWTLEFEFYMIFTSLTIFINV